MSEGDSTAHCPATAGVSAGMGLFGARSVENWTEMVASPATLSPLGVVLNTVNGVGGAAVVADAEVLCERRIDAYPAAATANVRAPTKKIHRRVLLGSFLRECFPVAMARRILPVDLAAQPRTEAQIAAVIWSRRPVSVTLCPMSSRT